MSKSNKSPLSLYDMNVVAPGELQISDDATDREVLRWWEQAMIYAETMRSLDRVTMLVRDDDEGVFYLASVEEVPHA